MYRDEDMLSLSGIQHFAFCRRQWALIHIEQQWEDNFLTVAGDLMHKRAHDEEIRERRGDVLIVRGLRISSHEIGFVGQCDIVEFHKREHGCSLVGEEGCWEVVPVEYKRGISKANDADRLQLCAQALCLEEMLCCDIEFGYLYYGKTKKREKVCFGQELRTKVANASKEMHLMYQRRHTPLVKQTKKCHACSLKDVCIPKNKTKSVKTYLASMIEVE